MQLDHPVDQPALQGRSPPAEDVEAGTRDPAAPGKIQNAQRLPQFPMRPRLEGQLSRLAPRPYDPVALHAAFGHTRVRYIRDCGERVGYPGVGVGHRGVQFADTRAHLAHAGNLVGRIAALSPHLAYAPGDPVSQRLEVVALPQRVASRPITLQQSANRAGRVVHPPARECGTHTLGIAAQLLDVQHRSR